jgi:hypothetical protein
MLPPLKGRTVTADAGTVSLVQRRRGLIVTGCVGAVAVVLAALALTIGRDGGDTAVPPAERHLAAAPAMAPAAHVTVPPRDAARAQLAYSAMQSTFAASGTHLYHGAVPFSPKHPYSQVWPFSQALAATIAMSAIPGIGSRYRADVTDRLAGLDRYWDSSASPPGYDPVTPATSAADRAKYYDDNEWIALELLKLHRLTGDATALRRASSLFDLVVDGWDDDASHACAGGVFWTQSKGSHTRNAVSTAPAAQIGLELRLLTGSTSAEQWARRMDAWVERCLRGTDGLYADNIDDDGARDEARWSYNQGMMVGADVLLYRLTGQRSYLMHAGTIADRALAALTADRDFHEPVFFASIFFENLLQLEAVTGGTRYRAAAQAYADRAWARQDGHGLFRFNTGSHTLLEQAAMVRLYAELAGGTGSPLLTATAPAR